MLVLLLLVVGFLARVITHAPNFTPVIALILFGGVYLDKKYAVLLPIFLMVVTDIILGIHSMMLFTWGSLVLVSFAGLWLRHHKNWINTAATSFLAAVAFFIITNFGVWVSGYYPPTLEGLLNCYVMAIPFFRSTLTSTLVYSVALFGIYELAAIRLRQTRFAHVL